MGTEDDAKIDAFAFWSFQLTTDYDQAAPDNANLGQSHSLSSGLMPSSGLSFPSSMPSGLLSLKLIKEPLFQTSELNACISTKKNSKASKAL